VSGFEGSYLGDAARISDAATLECKICWSPYDPALGDEARMVPPGTPFRLLPHDWRCPVCDAPKAQFMVSDDPGADLDGGVEAPRMAAAAGPSADEALRARLVSEPPKLVAEFREIWHAKMRDVPIVNRALHVEAVGFRGWQGRPVGVLVSPWFMNLILLPGPGEDWSGGVPGAKALIDFPSGTYEFIWNARGALGPYKACSLFSPMTEFASQLQATDCARAVMGALFDPANRAETDRAAEIRAAREADLRAEAEAGTASESAAGAKAETPASTAAGTAVGTAAAPKRAAPARDAAPSRRAVLTGGIAAPPAEMAPAPAPVAP
jgi:[NiFe] hydrogenase assembly HybE family chaperone